MLTLCPVTEVPLHNKYEELREEDEEEEIQEESVQSFPVDSARAPTARAEDDEESATTGTALADPSRACSGGSCRCRTLASNTWKPSLKHEPKRNAQEQCRRRESCLTIKEENLNSLIEVTTDTAHAVE